MILQDTGVVAGGQVIPSSNGYILPGICLTVMNYGISSMQSTQCCSSLSVFPLVPTVSNEAIRDSDCLKWDNGHADVFFRCIFAQLTNQQIARVGFRHSEY